MKIIRLTFDEDTGKVRIEGIGYQGPECDQAMAVFEQELIDPDKPHKRVNKPEYRQVAQNVRQTIKR